MTTPMRSEDYLDWVRGMADDLVGLPEAHFAERLARVIWFVHTNGAHHGINGLARILEEDYAVIGVPLGLPPVKGDPITPDVLVKWLRAVAEDMREACPQTVNIIPDELLPPLDGTAALRKLVASGVRQAEIVKKSGLPQPTVSKVARGQAKLGPKGTEWLHDAFPEAFQ